MTFERRFFLLGRSVMNEQRLRELIHLARSYHNLGKDLERWFEFEQVTPEESAAILAAVVPRRTQIQDEGLGVGPEVDVTWVDRMQETDWAIWGAHEYYLRIDLGRSEDMIRSIASESEAILRRLPDPRRAEFTGKGLVVGYVQSGKTASFTAVAARAVDTGYRLIIVLSGIHNNLRAQTQRRLDRELTGHLEPGELGIASPALDRDWYQLTDRGDYDFKGQHSQTILGHDVPILAVVKKNCTVLTDLLTWLKSAKPEALASCPTLIVDDEADQASVNTGQDRGEEEPEDPDDETSPSKTNELIRQIVSALPRVSYLAYTATPFANVLIDPESEDREAGRDLYPSDFIWQLPRPSEYTGTRELFGAIEHESRDVVRFIPDEDMDSLRPARARERGNWHPEISQTIIDAIDEFILAGAVRMHPSREQSEKHHTMLVHTSHYTECQERLANCIRKYGDGLHGNLQYGDGLIERLQRTWDRDYHQSLDDQDKLSFAAIEPHIRAFMAQPIPVLVLNSASDHVLDFEGDPIKAICIGGNRLSRGLTLEGLTISLFVRTTTMLDTLLQMARWYGFRIGYEDLIRIYTTPEIAGWFSELALVEDDLRAEIDRLRRSNLTPSEQGVRLRAHSALRLTSQAKSQNAVTRRSGWSGSHPQNIVLAIDAPERLQSDYDHTEAFLTRLKPGGQATGLTAPSQGADVVAYLRSLTDTGQARTFDLQSICEWIERQLSLGRLTDWTIHVPGNTNATARTIGIAGYEVQLVTRSRLRGSSSIGVLIDPKHEATDLDRPASDFKEGSSYDTNAMRQARPMNQGLLMIYLIDPASDSSARGRERLIPEQCADVPPAIVGVALSLPHVPDDEAETIIINEAFADA
jgi:hypothetical protein